MSFSTRSVPFRDRLLNLLPQPPPPLENVLLQVHGLLLPVQPAPGAEDLQVVIRREDLHLQHGILQVQQVGGQDGPPTANLLLRVFLYKVETLDVFSSFSSFALSVPLDLSRWSLHIVTTRLRSVSKVLFVY